ncbi:MAG: FIST C-terminal domain-containing protein [Polyangiaceae bacterium]|nr:FIST C-terminal domain-containing protein [Polyangiaceae bacterium]
MPVATSFDLVGCHAAELRRALEKSLKDLGGKIGGGIVFVCGSMSKELDETADLIRGMALSAPIIISAGAAVMTERGTHEHVSACAGMLWQKGHSVPFAMDIEAPNPITGRVAEVAKEAMSRSGPSAVIAVRELGTNPGVFDQMVGAPVFGGAVLEKSAASLVHEGKTISADILGLSMHGVGSAIVRVSPGCQILGTPEPVSAIDDNLMLTIRGTPALDVLRNQASSVVGQRPVLVAVDIGHDSRGHDRIMLRGIRGIHETRKGVVVSEPIKAGTKVAFAALDGNASTTNLETILREMNRDMHGGMPRFGFYIDCAGRGPQLYGEPDVDARILRKAFPGLPMLGLSTAFEIGPGPIGAAVHLFSGVFCLVYAPS